MARRRRSIAAALAGTALSAGVLIAGGQAPAAADHQTVLALKGSAFGYFSNVSLFGAPFSTRGPAPTVALPPTAR